jgi:hypothetical protein
MRCTRGRARQSPGGWDSVGSVGFGLVGSGEDGADSQNLHLQVGLLHTGGIADSEGIAGTRPALSPAAAESCWRGPAAATRRRGTGRWAHM